jgi:predicted DNA-binding protein (UPF0251 family)
MAGDRQSTEERVRFAERRRQALYLASIRGLTVGQIAELLQCSPRTISRDLRAAREQAKEQLAQQAEMASGLSDLAADIDANFRSAVEQGWTEFYSAAPGTPARARALRAVIAANQQRAENLRQLGLLRPAPEQAGMDVSFFGLTDEELARAIEEAGRGNTPT